MCYRAPNALKFPSMVGKELMPVFFCTLKVTVAIDLHDMNHQRPQF